MSDLFSTIAAIGPVDSAAMRVAEARQDRLTKPPQALGRLETLSLQLAGITGNPLPTMARKVIAVMAGDHGVVAEGVSAFPAEVTSQMVRNFLAGGAAISVIGRQVGARVVVTDVGVAADLSGAAGLRHCKVRSGTANLAQGPAMTRDEAIAACEVGIALVEDEIAQGLDLIATGEMGIGNTTPSAALTAAFLGLPVAHVTGGGTGVSGAALRHKIRVIEQALAVNQPDPADPVSTMAQVGGLEIAAMAGVMLGAAAHRRPAVIDGFISGAAALTAYRLCPAVADYLLSSHLSAEPGHRAILAELGLTPLFDLEMRLGEGTGAALAMGIIDVAAKLLCEMATFASAGVSGEMRAPAAGGEEPSRD